MLIKIEPYLLYRIQKSENLHSSTSSVANVGKSLRFETLVELQRTIIVILLLLAVELNLQVGLLISLSGIEDLVHHLLEVRDLLSSWSRLVAVTREDATHELVEGRRLNHGVNIDILKGGSRAQLHE